MSKRAIKALIDQGSVRDWDDPRLYTLRGLRRRGVPPGAILSFIAELGVTTANTSIQVARFDQSLRRFLERSVPRIMLVLDPIPVTIENFEDLNKTHMQVPFSPKDPEMGSHEVSVTKILFIDRSDFREAADDNFFRLAPGKTVGLLNFPAPITATRFTADSIGRVTHIFAMATPGAPKPRAFIHWVPDGSEEVEVRVHSSLFRSDQSSSGDGDLEDHLSSESEVVYKNALIEAGLDDVRSKSPWPRQTVGEQEDRHERLEGVRFQAMRIGYFVS